MKRTKFISSAWRSSRYLFSRSQLSTTTTQRKQDPKPFSEIPGSKGLPLIGNLPWMLRTVGKEKEEDKIWSSKLHQQFGPIFKLRMIGDTWLVNVSSPEDIETVFRAEGKYPRRGLFEENIMWLYEKLQIPPPMFFSVGEDWKTIRSNAAKQVVPRRVGNFVEPLSVIAEQLITHLETLQDESGNVEDVRSELYKWAFQGAAYFVYNEKVSVYSGIDPSHREFMEAALDYIEHISVIAGALPIYKLYRNKTYRNYERILKRLQKAGREIIARRYEEIKDSISSGTVDESETLGLLDQWLIERKFTEDEALTQSFDMLSAGIDTTATTACYLVYEIAKHPELQDLLTQEISSVLGDKTHPSWEDLQNMSLLRNCVKEVMRLYNLLPGTSRVLAEDVVLLGYKVPAGTQVIISLNAMARDSKVFKDPMEFNPGRWDKDSSEKPNPFSSLPFGFGPRSCYGRRLAELELYILMIMTLRKYKLSTNVREMKRIHKLLLKPAVPIHLNFQPRSVKRL